MKSVIKWQTGEPKEFGGYIITTNDGYVRHIYFHPKEAVDVVFFEMYVAAWCKLSDIKPYKEEKL